MSQIPKRIGLLGGSFNPAHGGHRRISLFALKALELDAVWWLVSPGNPLKSAKEMAPISARFKSAQAEARRVPIVPTVIEQQLGTRYTAETLKALTRRFPKQQFVWLMGSDNLAQFHQWHDWRGIARTMPIAVIARPGYDAAAMTSPAMAWFRKYRAPKAKFAKGTGRNAPRLTYLRFDPDARSATALRKRNPDWAEQYRGPAPRDPITHRLILPQGEV